MKSWLYLVAVIVVLLLLIAGGKAVSVSRTIAHFKAQGAPVYTVSTATARSSPWQASLTAIGSLHAVHGADIGPEVAGIVDGIEFDSGQDVARGQILIRLRAADDVAHLASLKATSGLAEVVYTRDKAQFAAQAIAQATLDSDAANLEAARAQVREQQAIVDKKFIRAPFAGRVGIRAVDPGQYVAAGTKLVTLQALDPIYVDFYLPQQELPKITVGEAVRITVGGGASYGGRITAFNPQIDSNTRNVEVRAELRNPKRALLPGMYVNVVIDSGASQSYLTLPQAAIVYNAYSDTVFVVKGGAKGGSPLTVQQQIVEVGPTRGDQVAVLKGLEEGDTVVTSGQLKLKNGAAVKVDNSVAPDADPDPHPGNE
jgi:membrane fusion protein (multidrug efflux system)